jgi:DNA invertase Pin-like site-specific DNA recombinase
MEDNKVVVYVRTSTTDLLNEDGNESRQIEFCRQFCKENDYNIISEYIDSGVSGMTCPMNRMTLKEALEDCVMNDATLVVADYARISRKLECLDTFDDHLESIGVEIIVIREEEVAEENEEPEVATPLERIAEMLLEEFCRIESQELFKRIKAGLKEKRCKLKVK